MATELRLNPSSGALRTWLASRVAVAVLWIFGAYELAGTGSPGSLLGRWDRWDADLYIKLARWGYNGYPRHYPDRGMAAFFPGEPLVLRAVHALTGNWVGAGLLISLVCGAVAVIALARIGELDSGGAVGDRAVRYFVLSPFAVFLAAGYSEALFLAFALPAWVALSRNRLAAAGILATLAAGVRITGVFLGVAMLVHYATLRRERGERLLEARAAWLAGPFLATAAFFAYLHAVTGDWLAWLHAETGTTWGRSFTAPWTSFTTTWGAVTNAAQPTAYRLAFAVEIVVVLAATALTAALLAARRWGEGVYVGLQLAALATSAYYLSVGRATLMWFPLWLLLARATTTRRWVDTAYLCVAPALMAVYVVGFTSGQWAG